jgi:hypothetical protein
MSTQQAFHCFAVNVAINTHGCNRVLKEAIRGRKNSTRKPTQARETMSARLCRLVAVHLDSSKTCCKPLHARIAGLICGLWSRLTVLAILFLMVAFYLRAVELTCEHFISIRKTSFGTRVAHEAWEHYGII